MSAKIYVVSLGPGGKEQMTDRAIKALETCDVITGYNVYVNLIKDEFPGKRFVSNGMRKEVDRCKATLEEALKGQTRVRHGRYHVRGSCRLSGCRY